ncbi:hypothetical protein pb186bvf_013532 [Paramecium bursaria]
MIVELKNYLPLHLVFIVFVCKQLQILDVYDQWFKVLLLLQQKHLNIKMKCFGFEILFFMNKL